MQAPPKIKVYVEGRYRKLVRDLPQTVFFCPDCKGHPRRRKGCERCEGFGKLTRDSVQELVGWVVGAAFKTRKNKFHGAGREDVDVRMLGEGRPFVMELIQPKETEVDLAKVEAEINQRNEGRLEVLRLCWSEKARVRELKETPRAKLYRARIAVEGSVDPAAFDKFRGKRITLEQQTPQRVAHRRADLARKRWVEYRELEAIEGESDMLVTLCTEHGTYVKEAIDGESGNTRPSFSELLGTPCRCVELDVLDILDDDGAPIEERARPETFTFGHMVD